MDLALGFTLLCSCRLSSAQGTPVRMGSQGPAELVWLCQGGWHCASLLLLPPSVVGWAMQNCQHPTILPTDRVVHAVQPNVCEGAGFKKVQNISWGTGVPLVPCRLLVRQESAKEVCCQRVFSHEGQFSIKVDLAPPLHSGPFQNLEARVYLNRHFF